MKKKITLYLSLLLICISMPLLTACCALLSPDDNDNSNSSSSISYDFTLNQEFCTINEGETFQLTLNFSNVNAEGSTVTWEIIDGDQIISLDNNGLVTALSPGYATVSATVENCTKHCYITVIRPVESFSLNYHSIEMYTNETIYLSIATLFPTDATEHCYIKEWVSSDESVAQIFSTGEIIPRSPGTTIITGYFKDNIYDSCTVTVIQYVPVTQLTLNMTSSQIYLNPPNNTTLDLVAEVQPENATNKTVYWRSSNTSIAQVDSNGHVTISNVGSCNIIASTQDGISATFYLTVSQEIVLTHISIISSITLVEGLDTYQLTPVFAPANATFKDVRWASSNTSVATVSNTGIVTPLSPGTAHIFVRSTIYNNIHDVCDVVVQDRIYPTSITIDQQASTLEECSTLQLTATILPETTHKKDIYWSIADESVATISSSGNVTGVYEGETTATATTYLEDGTPIESTITITVTERQIPVNVYINNSLTDTLYTARSQGYLVTLPQETDTSYYLYGWFNDPELNNPIRTTTAIFEDTANIYARRISKDCCTFTISTDEDTGYVSITGFSNPKNSDILYIPSAVNNTRVDYIASRAISSNSTIKVIVIDGYTKLKSSAFYNCSALEKVILINSPSEISPFCVSNCSNIKYNQFDNGYYIGSINNPYYAFIKTVGSPTTITIPAGCSILNNLHSTSVEQIVVESGNTKYSSYDGIVYNSTLSSIVCIPKNLSGSITISDKITTINSQQFSSLYKLTSINLNNSVTTINSEGFANCTSLQSVTGTNALTQIGEYAFSCCTSLKTITPLTNLKAVYSKAFENLKISSIVIPDSCTYIGPQVFANCSNLSTISLPYLGTSPTKPTTLGVLFGTTSGTNLVSCKQGSTYYLPYKLASVTIRGGDITTSALADLPSKITIILGEGITSIGNYAFEKNSISSLTLPSTITTINTGAFSSTTISNVYYLGEVDNWLNITFQNAYSNPRSVTQNFLFNDQVLTSVTIPDNITTLNQYAFYNFNELSSVTFNNNLTSIGRQCFYNTSITSFSAVASLTTIESGAFTNCTKLTTVNITNGVMTNIPSNCFKGCTALSNITLSNNITSIEEYAFYGCSQLESITLPNKITAINRGTFFSCSQLQSIIIPSQVTTIGQSAFENCTQLSTPTIPSSVTSIGSNAFANCLGFTHIDLSNTSMSKGEGLLAGCWNLEEITISNLSYLGKLFGTTSPHNSEDAIGVLHNSSTTAFLTNSYYVPTALKKVTILSGQIIFGGLSNCTMLETLVINKDVTKINSYALNGCTNLQSIYLDCTLTNTLPTASQILANVGRNLDSGTTLTFGKNATTIPANLLTDYTTDNKPNITSIIFEEGSQCESIQEYAFAYCDTITTLTIPASVTNIGNSAFFMCNNLTNLQINSNNNSFVMLDTHLYSYDQTVLHHVLPQTTTLNIVEDCTTIVDCVWQSLPQLHTINYNAINISDFEANNNLTTPLASNSLQVIFGSAVEHIPAYLFCPTTNHSLQISTISFAQGEEQKLTIGESAFAYNKGLQSVVLSNNILSIDNNAFLSCTNIASVQYLGTINNWTNITFGSYSNPMQHTTNFLINGQSPTTIQLDSSITKISNYAFYNFVNLASVTLPDTIQSIGDYAFANCTNLNYFYAPACNTIGNNMLHNCNSINNITIPFLGANIDTPQTIKWLFGVSGNNVIPSTLKTINILGGKITSQAFYNCQNITTISLADTIAVIGDSAFRECANLQTVNIPTSVTAINNYTFYNCSQLNLVSMPTAVTTIGDYAFYNCHSFTQLSLPNELSTIGTHAFYNCHQILTATIPSQVESIGDNAFKNCYKLFEVYNLSSLSILSGKTYCGYAGYYARIVHRSSSTASVLDTSLEGYTFGLIDSQLYLVSCTSDASSVTLPQHSTQADYIVCNYSISNLDTLTSITLPSYVVGVESSSFYNCTNLKNVSITSSITTFPDKLFDKCSSLKSFDYQGSCEEWSRLTFDTITSQPMYYCDTFTINGQYPTAITLSSELTEIGDYQFMKFNHATTISSLANITSIGKYAFYQCSSITSITIPTGVSVINESTFEGCSQLSTLTFHNAITDINDRGFANCSSLVTFTLPSGLTHIGSQAFAGCSKLMSFNTYYTSLETFSSEILMGCSSITNITLKNLNTFLTYYAPLNQLFGNNDIPQSIESISIYGGKIITGAFTDFAHVPNIILGHSITEIEQGAFDTSAEHVTLSNGVYYVSDWAIGTIASPNTITLLDTTKGLCNSLFEGTTLSSITLNSGLTHIGASAFASTAISNISLPSTVTNIGNSALESCTSLTYIDVAPSNSLYASDQGVLYNKNYTKLIQYPCNHANKNYTPLSTTTIIVSRAFAGSNIETFTANANLITIDTEAFANCVNLTDVVTNDKLTTINEKAFSSCSKLSSVYIGSSVNTIGAYTFVKCTKLSTRSTGIEFGNTSGWYVVKSSERIDLTSSTVGNSDTVTQLLTYTYESYVWHKL